MGTIDIADKVKHLPSGETWIVARVTDRDVYPAGWPMSCGDLSDCVLVSKATPEQKADMIESRKKLPRDDWRYLPQEQTP